MALHLVPLSRKSTACHNYSNIYFARFWKFHARKNCYSEAGAPSITLWNDIPDKVGVLPVSEYEFNEAMKGLRLEPPVGTSLNPDLLRLTYSNSCGGFGRL